MKIHHLSEKADSFAAKLALKYDGPEPGTNRFLKSHLSNIKRFHQPPEVASSPPAPASLGGGAVMYGKVVDCKYALGNWAKRVLNTVAANKLDRCLLNYDCNIGKFDEIEFDYYLPARAYSRNYGFIVYELCWLAGEGMTSISESIVRIHGARRGNGERENSSFAKPNIECIFFIAVACDELFQGKLTLAVCCTLLLANLHFRYCNVVRQLTSQDAYIGLHYTGSCCVHRECTAVSKHQLTLQHFATRHCLIAWIMYSSEQAPAYLAALRHTPLPYSVARNTSPLKQDASEIARTYWEKASTGNPLDQPEIGYKYAKQRADIGQYHAIAESRSQKWACTIADIDSGMTTTGPRKNGTTFYPVQLRKTRPVRISLAEEELLPASGRRAHYFPAGTRQYVSAVLSRGASLVKPCLHTGDAVCAIVPVITSEEALPAFCRRWWKGLLFCSEEDAR
ncbi:hypothetical protein PR048_025032 [Dryococelus australis]|uniref:Uncharacterized protein n=1 Tax=Dryococelus australis TaxID=614101 RepID=A0ABQ9GQ77_9NEOP|nr:hypothetical protein PR048_025032 [Dryococelus australis]